MSPAHLHQRSINAETDVALPAKALALPKAFAMGLSLGATARGKALSLGGGASRLVDPRTLEAFDAALPEGGLPCGAVVEVTSPRGLARATTLGLAACASAQAEARLRGAAGTDGAWCAWIDPAATLFAPGVAQAGVDLTRLLVVRPPPDALARVAVRVATSRAFAVIVVDTAGVPGDGQKAERLDRWAVIVRRLALATSGTTTTVLLLTDQGAARSLPLPTAMRIELERPGEDRMTLRVAKDRRGRITQPASIPLRRSA